MDLGDLNERNLLSVAYKNYVKTRRDAWRTIQAIQNKEELKVSTQHPDNKTARSNLIIIRKRQNK